MNLWTRLRENWIKFWKKNKKQKILIVIILYLVVVIVNYAMKNAPKKIEPPATTYKPHVAVIDSKEKVPEKYQQSIVNLVDTYFNYCNNGEYENAYNLITEECRKANYPTLEAFKMYVDTIFEGKKKIYNLQSYSIVDNKYIYNIRILDDILATGTTDNYSYYEEKIILTEENGEMKLSIAEYIGEEKPNIAVEEDDIKIEILSKKIEYETETYEIKITNKTDYYMVVSDNSQENEIILSLDNGANREPNNMQGANFFMYPNSSRTMKVCFNKFYDDGAKAKKIVFGAIRILQEYDFEKKTTEENLTNALRLFGLEVEVS